MSSDLRPLAWIPLLAALAAAPVVGAEPPAFSGARAMAWLEAQCDLGPRPPGSPALARLRDLVLAHADSLGLPAWKLCFTTRDPWDGDPIEVCNLVISAGPPAGQRLWLGAHYDTRPAADRDPDPARRAQPILGANDGASGVAVLLHLMELLAQRPPPLGIDILLFDAEDSGHGGAAEGFCVGSRHLAAHWRDFSSPLATGEPVGLILLDMVGGKGLRVPQEGYSREGAPAFTDAVYARAAELGLPEFPAVPGAAIYDDHVPFLNAGIPAVDLVGLPYAQWHTVGDVPQACDPAALAAVGRLVTSLCYVPLSGF